MDYFEWLETQAMEGERKPIPSCGNTTEPSSLRDLRRARIGERDIDMDAPDYEEQAENAALEMLDSGKLGHGTYAGRSLRNIEMHWIVRELRYGRRAQIQLFANRLLAWIGASKHGD